MSENLISGDTNIAFVKKLKFFKAFDVVKVKHKAFK